MPTQPPQFNEHQALSREHSRDRSKRCRRFGLRRLRSAVTVAAALRPETVNESWIEVVRTINQDDIVEVALSPCSTEMIHVVRRLSEGTQRCLKRYNRVEPKDEERA